MPIPTKPQFQKASNLRTVRSNAAGGRGMDKRLQRVDDLLDQYEKIHPKGTQESVVHLGVLYYAAEIWLKALDRKDPSVHEGRKASVNKLYGEVVQELSTQSTVPVNLLPGWLVATFGRGMTEHGVEVDLAHHSAKYMDKEEREKFRLEFRNGLAYQQKWWAQSTELVLANSVTVQPIPAHNNPTEITRGYSGYVLSQAGDFYTNKHMGGATGRRIGQFHSTYFAGEAILCAGEIKIEEGVVKAINTSSGHYQPSKRSMTLALQVLTCLGAYRPDISVKVFELDATSAERYLYMESIWKGRFGVSEDFGGHGPNVVRRPRNDHDRHLTAHKLQQSLPDRNLEAELAQAVDVIKRHWLSKRDGGHGPYGKEKCAECCKFRQHWEILMSIVKQSGGAAKATFTPRPNINQGIPGFATRHLG